MGLLFLKQVKTGTAYTECSFLAGLQLRDYKKLGLRLRPWARIQTPGTATLTPTPHPWYNCTVTKLYLTGQKLQSGTRI